MRPRAFRNLFGSSSFPPAVKDFFLFRIYSTSSAITFWESWISGVLWDLSVLGSRVSALGKNWTENTFIFFLKVLASPSWVSKSGTRERSGVLLAFVFPHFASFQNFEELASSWTCYLKVFCFLSLTAFFLFLVTCSRSSWDTCSLRTCLLTLLFSLTLFWISWFHQETEWPDCFWPQLYYART